VLMFVFAPVHWVEWLPGGIFLLLPIVLGVRVRNVELQPVDVRT
jgi:hypothetical protein